MKPLLWGELVPGPYAVGFRMTLTTDYSRSYGLNPAGEAQHYRPILIAVWYPAVPDADAAPMTYGDYLRVSAEAESFAGFAERSMAYLREMTLRYGLEVKPENTTEEDQARFAEWERFPMFAVRDATLVAERFPVVFYHPGLGGTYDDNSVLCEYLASQGYLVVSSGFQSEDASQLNVDWDLTRSIKDLGFLMNYIAQDSQADMAHIGAIGQSYGGQAVMAWSSEDGSPVHAVISLDSTVDYGSIDDPRLVKLKAHLERSRNVTAALLLFAVQERHPNWGQWDLLSQSPRWYASTGLLQHNDFTSQGLIGTLQRSTLDVAAGVRQRFDAVCDLTRRFLDGYLKGDHAANYSLMQTALETASVKPELLEDPSTVESPLILQYKPPAPGPTAA